jgi:hypothetical protein
MRDKLPSAARAQLVLIVSGIERERQRKIAVLRIAHVVDMPWGLFERVLADESRAGFR